TPSGALQLSLTLEAPVAAAFDPQLALDAALELAVPVHDDAALSRYQTLWPETTGSPQREVAVEPLRWAHWRGLEATVTRDPDPAIQAALMPTPRLLSHALQPLRYRLPGP